ncbi:MAG: AAA family ATPase [Burkholderiales bacterium]|nr:AAA family ATPase [Burkholderiales bacterium]
MSIPGYVVAQEIYRNAHSVTYRATELSSGQPVLLKLAHANHEYHEAHATTSNNSLRSRFQLEYAIMQKLGGNGALKPTQWLGMEGALGIVCADFPGQSLEQLVSAQPLDLPHFFSIALQMTEVLGGLHQIDVIHLDLNTAVVLYDPHSQQIKLADFGSASQLSREHQPLVSPQILHGNLAYISPEQTGRMNRAIDYRSDFYSLGVSFYRLLTGELPFNATDAMGMVYCHIAQEPVAPDQLREDIPPALAQIVLKLLAKTAEQRYQSAYGIKADLLECERQWRTGKQAATFVPGLQDISSRFMVPQKLYGRDDAIEHLQSAFERISAGNPEMVLVLGPSGIGKSNLVNEIHKLAAKTRQGGYFVTGRCDQYRGNQPYHVLIEAFQQLTRQLLTESEEQIAHWREEMCAALGSNGQIIIDLIPEIQLIVGPQPALAPLAPSEMQNRFNAVFQNFIGIFAKREHPFTIFLDDLHWADAATLRLIQNLMLDTSNGPLLLLGAYRNNEVTPETLLAQMISSIRRAGKNVREIELPPLECEHIQSLVADTLNCELESARPLAWLVHRKTQGIPFFVNHLMYALFAARLIEFDTEQGRWQWDIEAIQKSPISDNVIDLMLQNIRRLDPATQRLLQYAATLGLNFDVETLSLVTDTPLEETNLKLWLALQNGLIIRIGEERGGNSAAERNHVNCASNMIYEFQHPRIQQAAYSLIAPQHHAALHYQVGRTLLRNLTPNKRIERMFDIVNHLNAASSLISAEAERIELAELNLRAGQRAASSIAYDTAASYFSAGIACLPAGSWQQLYALSFALNLQQAIALSNIGQLTQAHAVFSHALQQAQNACDKAAVCEQYSIALQNSGDASEALRIVKQGLSLFGIQFPHDELALASETATLLARLTQEETIAHFAQLPQAPLEDRLIDQLYERCIISAYFAEPQNLSLIISRNVQHVLERGMTPEAGVALAWFAMILGVAGKLKQSFEYGELALQLTQHFNDPYFQGKTELLAHCQSLCWKYPFAQNEAALERAYHLCHGTGDRRLMGTNHSITFDLNHAEVIMAAYEQENNCTDICEALTELARNAMLFGDLDLAWRYCQRAAPFVARGACGNLLVIMMYYHISVVCGAQIHARQADAEIATNALQALEKLRNMAEVSPDNFLSYYKMALGQWQLGCGEQDQAGACFLQAIRHARQHGYVLLQAWANEALAQMYAADGWQVAQAHMDEAQRLYRECGALGKVRAMQKRANSQAKTSELQAAINPPSKVSSNDTVSPHPQRVIGPQLLDLSTIVKSSQAISSEIELDKLIERMMHIIVENAGAQDGMLLLYKDDVLVLHATVEQQLVKLVNGQEPACGINWAVIHYVARTNTPVVLDNAAQAGPFVRDAWIRRQQPRAVLCVPLLNQGRVTGIIYLENNLVPGAFTPDRIAVLELLASQAAIALQNAMLYADLQREQTLIRELNEGLEQRVVERTAEAEGARKRLTDITEALPLSVFQTRVVDGVMSYVFVSENVSSILGVSATEIKANSESRWRNVLPQDRDTCQADIRHAIETMTPCEFSQRVEFDGRVRWIHAYTVAPKWIDEGWVWNGFWIDETTNRLQEEELREAKNLAEAATRTKSLFLANMSHEIRTPMNAIIGLSHLALMTQLSERQHDYIAKIHNAGTALLGIINDILDFSKIEAGQLTVEHTDFMLEQVTDNITAMLGQKVLSKGLRLVFDLAPDLPPCLCGDPLRLGQVFVNLISNAVKFTEHGEIRLRGKLMEAVGARVKLKFSVQDSGIGINPQQAQRLSDQPTNRD